MIHVPRQPGDAHLRLRRASFWGLVVATALAGTALMAGIVSAGGIAPLEWLILALFAPTFSWIVVPFWTAIAGFVLLVLRRDPLTLARLRPPAPVDGALPRTALVVPVYNEDADAVAARISATARSLVQLGRAGDFDVHLLSDSTDAAVIAREQAALAALQGRHPEMRFAYRHRAHNTGRKAGNLAEFCERAGHAYECMVVLDADSVMAGPTLVAMAARMRAEPGLALVQTVPLPAGQHTVFGRLVQFAARLHAPALAHGLAFWQGDTANYWGHNAMIRIAPFARHARLPVLSGRPPLGGEILSHDFVEAALLRRAGWRVVLDPTLGGSWEEVPATLPDFGRRDRRWAQGSLQHLRLLTLPGLHPLSRMHFVLGAMAYLSSVLWLLTLLAGTAWVLVPAARGMGSGAGLGFGAGTIIGSAFTPILPPGVPLLGLTAVLLFLPKVLGLTLALLRERADFGGTRRLVAGALLETGVSIVLAPFMMVEHTRYVTGILAGRAVGWSVQTRQGRTLAWGPAARAGAPATVLGLVWGGATLALSPLFFVWMSPIFAGLLLSIPLLRWTSSPRLGRALRAQGLLTVPAESDPPSELAAAHGSVTDPSPERDPTPLIGVLGHPRKPLQRPQIPMKNSMHKAERGLFDVQRGRPLLVRSGPGHDVVVLAVEGLGDERLAEARRLGGERADARLVVTAHRALAMGIAPVSADPGAQAFSFAIEAEADAARVLDLATGRVPAGASVAPVTLSRSTGVAAADVASVAEAAGLALAHLARMVPAVVAVPVGREPGAELVAALADGRVLEAPAGEIHDFVRMAGIEVVRVVEAPVPLPEAEHSRFTLFREAFGLAEHVAIQVGDPAEWADPVPVRLHSACLTGDLFGSLRCDCGEQLRGSMSLFAARGGGVLLYLAQEGRGIGLGNKFRAYSLQETGLDTIDADCTLGFGADERRYEVAVAMLESLGIRRVELLTNNPEKMAALEQAGISVAHRRPLHGRLNRHNLPYVRAKVNRAGHWLRDMLAQPLAGD